LEKQGMEKQDMEMEIIIELMPCDENDDRKINKETQKQIPVMFNNYMSFLEITYDTEQIHQKMGIKADTKVDTNDKEETSTVAKICE
jgi:hypothetical protein